MGINISSISKKMTIVGIVATTAFVAFAGFTAQSVINMSDLVSRASLSDDKGVPSIWSGTAYSSAISTSTQVKDAGDHLAYLTVIENKSSHIPVYLTSIASRINDSKNTGFISFDQGSIEYSYSASSSAWMEISGTVDNGTYKLDNALRLGPASTSSNKVYLRYKLSPEAGNVSDKISLLFEDEDGATSIATSESSIAYEKLENEVVAIENSHSTADDNSAESAFAEPLGAVSEATSLSTITTSSIGSINIPPEAMTASLVAVVAVLGIFVGSLITFLIIKKPNTKAKKSKR
ncbi:hypothetical protein J6S35_01890 [Candidatus Saccharibacteria bacterium]|nr:hypothetical protein [Candidatus Saccharibacteria bacterium]